MGMALGIGLGVGRGAVEAGAPNPIPAWLALYGAYAWIPVAGKTWQERDGSRLTPAAADGDPVGEVAEYTGAGASWKADADAHRPLLKISGGLRWLLGDVTTGMTIAGQFLAATALYRAAVLRGTGGDGGLWRMNSDATAMPYYRYVGTDVIYESFGTLVRRGPIAAGVSLAADRVYEVVASGSAWQAWLDGSSVLAAGSNTLPGGTAPWVLFNNVEATTQARLYGLVVAPTNPTSGDRATIRTALGALAGLTL